MAQHRARTHRARRWVAGTLLVLGVLLCMAWAHGNALRTQAQQACMPGVPAYSTGHMHINPCATLDASQVQDRRPKATDTLYVCTEEDGSAPGQMFPCLWDAHGQGTTYILDGPAS